MTLRKNIGLMAITGVAAIAVAGVGLLMAGPRDGKGRKTEPASTAALKIGDKAPEFTLKDTEGKEHKLSDYTKKGKIVVIEWFNSGCPFIKLHHEKQTTVADLYKDFKDKDVAFIAINSTNSGHSDFGKDADAKTRWKIEFPILIDSDGKVGHAYGAKTTPHMFVIDKNGMLAYQGAMDNDPRMDKKDAEKVNYVRAALNDLTAGKKVATPETKPYGCSVKY
ncbi:MAG: thioredoxin family protein [Phycisphaerae bacterium]|nr:MAG: thioredoxin family protein [Planctomycetia bacterium]GJQ27278.1 MAG: thioredoxin family protein [Phycisphaerae bacterium]